MIEALHVKTNYVIFRKTTLNWSIGPRNISDYELVIVTGGTGRYLIDNTEKKLKRGDILFITPRYHHSFLTDPTDLLCFYGIHFEFSADTEAEKAASLFPAYFQSGKFYPTAKLAAVLWNLHRQKPYLYRLKENMLVEEILYELICENHSLSAKNYDRMNLVLEKIHNSPYEDYSIDELAELAGIKKSYFILLFRELTGQTPIQYILSLKLEHACDRLLASDRPVKEIARGCGFEDEFYFSRAFKKKFGVPPKIYRQLHFPI